MSLEKDIEKKISEWNERSTFSLKGINGLSKSDLETLKLYARTIELNGTCEGFLMAPRGNIEAVLKKYNYL